MPRFDDDAVTDPESADTLSLLIDAAPHRLPQISRQDLAIAAWTRAVLLQDAGSAAKLQPLLPKAIRDAAGSSIGFPADLAILTIPVFGPISKPEFRVSPATATSILSATTGGASPGANARTMTRRNQSLFPSRASIPADALARANYEYQQLQQLPDSVAVVGHRVIDYANDHPDESTIPEALALVVRAGHYACRAL